MRGLSSTGCRLMSGSGCVPVCALSGQQQQGLHAAACRAAAHCAGVFSGSTLCAHVVGSWPGAAEDSMLLLLPCLHSSSLEPLRPPFPAGAAVVLGHCTPRCRPSRTAAKSRSSPTLAAPSSWLGQAAQQTSIRRTSMPARWGGRAGQSAADVFGMVSATTAEREVWCGRLDESFFAFGLANIGCDDGGVWLRKC